VAGRLEPFILNEFRTLPDHERTAAIQAVTDTLTAVGFTDRDLFAVDLDAGQLFRFVRRTAPDVKQHAGLSGDAAAVCDLVLRESCGYVIQFGTALPQAGMAGLTEVLRRETELHRLVEEALDRLPERRGLAEFERDYRRSSPTSRPGRVLRRHAVGRESSLPAVRRLSEPDRIVRRRKGCLVGGSGRRRVRRPGLE
jgi:hypothetical protein